MPDQTPEQTAEAAAENLDPELEPDTLIRFAHDHYTGQGYDGLGDCLFALLCDVTVLYASQQRSSGVPRHIAVQGVLETVIGNVAPEYDADEATPGEWRPPISEDDSPQQLMAARGQLINWIAVIEEILREKHGSKIMTF